MKTISFEDWQQEGERLFGQNRFDWKFKCPVCGHVATPRDFEKYRDLGSTPNSAISECIGRYMPEDQRGKNLSGDRQPCDYAAYGLLNLCTLTVLGSSGEVSEEPLQIFDFAYPTVEPVKHAPQESPDHPQENAG